MKNRLNDWIGLLGFLFLDLVWCLICIGSCVVVLQMVSGSEALHDLFRRSCHQISDRCFMIGAQTTPICARCIGIYVGILIEPIVSRQSFRNIYLLCGIAAFCELSMKVVGVDVSNSLRCVAGICIAVFLFGFLRTWILAILSGNRKHVLSLEEPTFDSRAQQYSNGGEKLEARAARIEAIER